MCAVSVTSAWKIRSVLPLALSVHRRLYQGAPLFLSGLLAFSCPVRPQAQTAEPQQTPAPIIRPRPKAQTGVPVTAPPDAAPLVNRSPRVRPINPQDLVGTPASSGQTAARPRATQANGATGSTTPAHSAAGITTTGQAATPKPARRIPSPTATGTTTPPTTGAGAGARSTLSANGLNRTVIVLDPGHGGADSGSRIGDSTLEKNVTLALAFRLRSLLIARGFTVVLTRDNDSGLAFAGPTSGQLTLDDRAGIANHARASACLFLHATGRGNGLHLYTSELQPAPGETTQLPWLTAQAAWVPASEQLERSVSSALGRSHIALVSSTASVRPLDSLTCPAMVMELAPEGSDAQSVNDAGYQDRIAAAVAGALVFWQNQVQAPPKLTLAPPATHTVRHRAAAVTPSTSAEPKP